MTEPTDADRAKAAEVVRGLSPKQYVDEFVYDGEVEPLIDAIAAALAAERAAAVADLRARVEPILSRVETAEDESTTAERRLVRQLRVAITDTTGDPA